MSKEIFIIPKFWCRLNMGGAEEQCERALRMANELPDPLGLNRMDKAPVVIIEKLVKKGILEEVRSRVFKPTGKGRDFYI